MKKTQIARLEPLTPKQLEVLSIIEAYEQSKMCRMTLIEFVKTYERGTK